MGTLRTAKLSYMISSVILCMTGMLIIIYPTISITVFCYIIGGLLMAWGAIKVIGYFAKDIYQLAFQFDLALGLFSGLIGLVMILHPTATAAMLDFVIGVVVLADSLFKIQTAIDAKRFGLSKWWMIAGAAVLASVFGLLLVIKPLEEAAVITVFIGIALLLEGLLNLCVSICAVKI